MPVYISGILYLSAILCAVLTARATSASESKTAIVDVLDQELKQESMDRFETFTSQLAHLVAEAFHYKNQVSAEEQSLDQLADRSCDVAVQAGESQKVMARRLLICQVKNHAESLLEPSPYVDTMHLIATLKTEHIDRFKDAFESLKVAAGESQVKTKEYADLLEKLVVNWARWKAAADKFKQNFKPDPGPPIPVWEDDPDNKRLKDEIKKNDDKIKAIESDIGKLKDEEIPQPPAPVEKACEHKCPARGTQWNPAQRKDCLAFHDHEDNSHSDTETRARGCEASGCCWDPIKNGDGSMKHGSNEPWCFQNPCIPPDVVPAQLTKPTGADVLQPTPTEPKETKTCGQAITNDGTLCTKQVKLRIPEKMDNPCSNCASECCKGVLTIVEPPVEASAQICCSVPDMPGLCKVTCPASDASCKQIPCHHFYGEVMAYWAANIARMKEGESARLEYGESDDFFETEKWPNNMRAIAKRLDLPAESDYRPVQKAGTSCSQECQVKTYFGFKCFDGDEVEVKDVPATSVPPLGTLENPGFKISEGLTRRRRKVTVRHKGKKRDDYVVAASHVTKLNADGKQQACDKNVKPISDSLSTSLSGEQMKRGGSCFDEGRKSIDEKPVNWARDPWREPGMATQTGRDCIFCCERRFTTGDREGQQMNPPYCFAPKKMDDVQNWFSEDLQVEDKACKTLHTPHAEATLVDINYCRLWMAEGRQEVSFCGT